MTVKIPFKGKIIILNVHKPPVQRAEGGASPGVNQPGVKL